MITLLDEFQGAANALLSAHTPQIGSPWTIVAGRAPALDGTGSPRLWTNTGGVFCPDSGASAAPFAAQAAVMGTADYSVSAVIRRYAGAGAGDTFGIIGRWDGAATWYELRYEEANDQWHLVKKVAGTETELAAYNLPLVVGAALPIRLSMVGTTITAKLGNTSQTPVTDADVAGPGKPALRKIGSGPDTATTGFHAEQFVAAAIP